MIPVSVVAGLEQSWKLCYVLCSAAIGKEVVNLNRAGGAEEDVEGYGLVASYC